MLVSGCSSITQLRGLKRCLHEQQQNFDSNCRWKPGEVGLNAIAYAYHPHLSNRVYRDAYLIVA
jgi:hypothetical protein